MTFPLRLLLQGLLPVLGLAACGDSEGGAGAGGDGQGGGPAGPATTGASVASTGSGSTTSGNQAGSGGGGDQGGAGGGGASGGAGGAGGSASDSDQQSVGVDGATLTAGGATVTIPEGALTETTTIGIARLDDGEIAQLPEIDLVGATSASLSDDVFALTPHGTSFQQAVTIELPAFEGATILRLDDESDTTWEIVPATIVEGQAVLTTWSFSVYAVADVDGTPGCDPVACEARPDDEFVQDYACVFMSDSYDGPAGPGYWSCAEACTEDEQCAFSFDPYCENETMLVDVAGWYCGIPEGEVSGGCTGFIGGSDCHGSDGQSPEVTLCVDGACTDTPAG